MYDICHPGYYRIGNLGCSDPVKISTTFYVYIELCEKKLFWDVKYKYNEDLDLLYLEAKRTKNSSIEIFVPWPTIHNISIAQIENIQEKLQTKQFTFVFKAEDSTSVHYKVTAGLVKPTSPETSKKLREKEEKKLELQKEIRKNTSNLYEIAKILAANNDQNVTTEASTSEQDVIVIADNSK